MNKRSTFRMKLIKKHIDPELPAFQSTWCRMHLLLALCYAIPQGLGYNASRLSAL